MHLLLHTASADVSRAVEAHRELIATETLAADVRIESAAPSESETWDLGEGRERTGAVERL